LRETKYEAERGYHEKSPQPSNEFPRGIQRTGGRSGAFSRNQLSHNDRSGTHSANVVSPNILGTNLQFQRSC